MTYILTFGNWRDLALHLHAKICGKCKVKYKQCANCYQALSIKRLVEKEAQP